MMQEIERPNLIIEGDKIIDIPSFYQIINALFMANEDWKIAESLDALDDMMYGGFGYLSENPYILLTWKNHLTSAENLGVSLTIAHYQSKIYPNSPYNQTLFKSKIKALENQSGETYFQIILSIINSHPNICLKLA